MSTGGKPALAGLISSQFLDLCYVRCNTADVIDLQVCGHEAERALETLLTSTHLCQTGQHIANRRSLLCREKENHVPFIHYPFLHLLSSHPAFASVPAGANRGKKQRSLYPARDPLSCKHRVASAGAWPSHSPAL